MFRSSGTVIFFTTHIATSRRIHSEDVLGAVEDSFSVFAEKPDRQGSQLMALGSLASLIIHVATLHIFSRI